MQTEEDLHQAASQYTVFGRVTPEQKKSLVEGLQAKGHKVAMTGDGVNDILALKQRIVVLRWNLEMMRPKDGASGLTGF